MIRLRHTTSVALAVAAVACSLPVLTSAVRAAPVQVTSSTAPVLSQTRSATHQAQARQVAPTTPAGSLSQTVQVLVPSVVFTATAEAHDGRLRVPVALTELGQSGYAGVAGIEGCRTTLTPGQVSWLDCVVRAEAEGLEIVAVLADGTAVRGPSIHLV